MGGRSNDRLARRTGSDGARSIRRDRQPPLQRRRERCWRFPTAGARHGLLLKKPIPCRELTPTWRVAFMELTARQWPVRTRLGPKRTAPTRSFLLCLRCRPAAALPQGATRAWVNACSYLPCCLGCWDCEGSVGLQVGERSCHTASSARSSRAGGDQAGDDARAGSARSPEARVASPSV